MGTCISIPKPENFLPSVLTLPSDLNRRSGLAFVWTTYSFNPADKIVTLMLEEYSWVENLNTYTGELQLTKRISYSNEDFSKSYKKYFDDKLVYIKSKGLKSQYIGLDAFNKLKKQFIEEEIKKLNKLKARDDAERLHIYKMKHDPEYRINYEEKQRQERERYRRAMERIQREIKENERRASNNSGNPIALFGGFEIMLSAYTNAAASSNNSTIADD